MLKCSTSLWSADLSNLASEIRRVEPYTERFHLDVADGHYVPNLLFFPDLVKAIRAHTRLPLEVHLMVTDPSIWIAPFIDSGADGIILCYDSLSEPLGALRNIKQMKKFTGISLRISEPLELLDPLWEQLDLVTLIGTELGIKGASMDPSIPTKVGHARKVITQRKLLTEIEADGGIRRETVPLLKAAGADFIVPGSLMFKEEPRAMREWLSTC